MANNRMYLVHDVSGQRVLLAKHFGGKWLPYVGGEGHAEPELATRLDAAFAEEVGVGTPSRRIGSTAWHVEYEEHGKYDDQLMPSTVEGEALFLVRTDKRELHAATLEDAFVELAALYTELPAVLGARKNPTANQAIMATRTALVSCELKPGVWLVSKHLAGVPIATIVRLRSDTPERDVEMAIAKARIEAQGGWFDVKGWLARYESRKP